MSDDAPPATLETSAPGLPIGTVRATLDGTPRTWYVVPGGGADRPLVERHELDLGTGPVVSPSGLDSPTPPLGTFEIDPATGQSRLGDYDGSSLALLVPLPQRPGNTRFVLPDDEDAGVSVVYPPTRRRSRPGST